MRHRSKEWTRLAARGQFNFDARAVIAGKEYYRITAPQISHNLATDPLSIGNCNAASLKLTVLLEDGEEIPEAAEVKIIGRLTDLDITTSTEVLPFGTYWVDTCTQTENLYTLTCYDAMLKTSQAMVDETSNKADWPKTMTKVVQEIAARIGVGIDPRTRINQGPNYMVPYPEAYTMQQVLGWIGACNGGNWTITDEGLLRLVALTAPPDETYHIVDSDYNDIVTAGGDTLVWAMSDDSTTAVPEIGLPVESPIQQSYPIIDDKFNRIMTSDGFLLVYDEAGSIQAEQGLLHIPIVRGDLSTGKRLKVSGILMTDEDGNSYAKGDDSGFVIEIDGCPYACAGICADLYKMLVNVEYEPFTAPDAAFDPAAELGDQVEIGDKVHSSIYEMNTTLDIGYACTISAPTNSETTRQYPYLKGKDKKIEDALKNAEKAQADVDALEPRVTKAEASITQTETEISLRATKEELSDAVTDAKAYADAQLKISAEEISSSVSKGYATKADLGKTNDNLNSLKNRVTTAETNIKQTAEEITLKASKTEAKGYANTAESNAKSYSDAQIKVSADEIKLGVAKTSHDPLNHAQLNKDTASAWGFTAADEADGVWYTMKTLKRLTLISDPFTCKGGEELRVRATVNTTVKGNSSNGGTDSTYRNISFMIIGADGNGKDNYWPTTATVSNGTKEIDSTVKLSAAVRFFRVYIYIDSYGNFSGTLKLKNIEVSKVGALETRISKAETSITQNENDITLRATKSEAQGYATNAEKNAKTYADAQLKISANEISTKVTAAQNTANSAQADANALKTRVEKAETSIKQTASDITLKASKTEAQGYANSAKDSAVSAAKTYTDAQIKVSADEIKLGVAKTSHDPLNYAQLNKDTASAWGFTAADEADGVWYTMKTLKRLTLISDPFTCKGGEELRVRATVNTTVKGNSSNGGTDSTYRNISFMIIGADGNGKDNYWPTTATVSNGTKEIDSTVKLSAAVRFFRVYIYIDSYGNFSGTLKLKNIEVSKVGALETRISKAETSITQNENDITLRATKSEAQGYATNAEKNAKTYADAQLKISANEISTKVTAAQNTANSAQADANALKTRVEKAETSIKQTASDITLKASKTEAQGYANSAKDSAVSAAKTYTDAQIKVSADEIKLGVAKTSHDPLNYAQLNKDTASAWGFTAADEADGVWYTLKTLKRDTSISNTFSCEGGEKLRVQGTISTTVKGNSSNGGTDSAYRNCSIMIQCCDATYKNYSWPCSAAVSNSTQKIDSTITLPTTARYFNIFVHINSFGNFSGSIKVKNIEVSKVSALESQLKITSEEIKGEVKGLTDRMGKAETSITQTKSDITLRANTAEKNAKDYSDAQLKITADSINSTVKGLSDRMGSAETSINQTKNDITLKASKTEVTTAKNEAISTAAKDATTKANTAQTNAVNAVTKYTDAQIQTLAGEINLKASQKSVNDLSGRVDSAVASINVNAGAIEMKASKTEAQGYANKAESNAKTAAASDATTKANNAKTAAINAAATDASNKANAAEKNAKNELYSMMTFTADSGLVITHSGWSGKVQITGQNIQVIRGNNKVIVNDSGISITDGTSSCSIGTSGVSITDSKGSVNINSGALTFKGVKNNVELFKNDATTYAAQTYTVDLSKYAAILVTFRSNKGGTWFAGGGNAGLVSMIVPVNGIEMSMVYPWNTVHKRSITAYTNKIVFGTGYQRTSRYTTGIVNYFDLQDPVSDGWKEDDTKCVPYRIYGFL